MRYVTIGRHEFAPIQRRLLEKAGLTEEVSRVTNVNDVNEVVAKAKESGAQAIVVQALPPHLLAALHQAAKRAGVDVYVFELDHSNAKMFKDENEIPEDVKETHVLVHSREGTVRAIPVKGIRKVENVVFTIEGPVITP